MVVLSRQAGDGTRDEQQLRAVLDALPIALLLIDQTGTVRYANHPAAVVFDHARRDMPGEAVATLLPGATGEIWPQTCATAPIAGQRACQDSTAHRRGGEVFPVALLFNTLHLDGALHVVIAVNDLTEQRRAEQELAFERESMAHMSRVSLVGEISGSLAHELNQPLAAILSNAQAALRILRRDPGEITDIREILEDIVENDRRAVELINRVRGLLRRECRSFSPVVVDEIVLDSIRILRSDLINRGVEYRLDLRMPVSRVHGDSVQLQQVLLNLMLNACDAMVGAPRRVLTVRTDAIGAQWIRVAVCDTGPGIATEGLESIFAPYRSTKPDGMGMGLAICRSLLNAHGGRIHAGNVPGGGAVFFVELPILE